MVACGLAALLQASLVAFTAMKYADGIYALLTIVGFTLRSAGAASLARVIERRPKVIDGLNIGAALVFFLSGLRIATFEQPR